MKRKLVYSCYLDYLSLIKLCAIIRVWINWEFLAFTRTFHEIKSLIKVCNKMSMIPFSSVWKEREAWKFEKNIVCERKKSMRKKMRKRKEENSMPSTQIGDSYQAPQETISVHYTCTWPNLIWFWILSWHLIWFDNISMIGKPHSPHYPELHKKALVV